MKPASNLLFALAALASLVALYLYTFCVPLESACHLATPGACERLAATLRTSTWAAIAAVLSAVVALFLNRWSAHAARRDGASSRCR